jgi:hypothetical protein
MYEINPATAATRFAVQFLTLWMESDVAARWSAAEHFHRVLNDPEGPGAMSIIAGHCNLSMLLVLMLAKERGAKDIEAKAREILRELSRDLPE